MKSIILIACACFAIIQTSAPAQNVVTQEQQQSAVKVDLNTATERRIAELPGVGEVNARKIIAARPFASTADLAAAGVPQAVIEKIATLVTFSSASTAQAPSKERESILVAVPPRNIPAHVLDKNPAKPPRDNIDLNKASSQQLQELPGIDAKKALDIIAHRPYAAPSEITKAGFSPYEAQALLPFLYVSRPASTVPLNKPALK
jgi:DNA uptake protein ComE-like DNA-binding protein